MLISTAVLLALTDKYAYVWRALREALGGSAWVLNPASGWQKAQEARDLVVQSQDYEQERDLVAAVGDAADLFVVEAQSDLFAGLISALDAHCSGRGADVDDSITSLATYLAYLNDPDTGAPWSVLLAREFGEVYEAATGNVLPPGTVMHPAIHPGYPGADGAAVAAGMGTCTVPTGFSAGAAADVTRYAAVEPFVVVTGAFAGGTAAPDVTVTGTDDEGTEGQTWTATLAGVNPVSAVATTLATIDVGAPTVLNFTLADPAGVVVGSVLLIDAGTDLEEVVVVQHEAGGTFMAVFLKEHAAGGTVDGLRSYHLNPPAATRRLREVTNVALTIDTHTAGQVKVCGRLDRVPI